MGPYTNMGIFSFLTTDTRESIVIHGFDKSRTVYMWSDDGQCWCEYHYEGYGIFGGKDIFILYAEMNGLIPLDYTIDSDTDEIVEEESPVWDIIRSFAIDHMFSSVAEKRYPNLTFSSTWIWRNEELEYCPYQGGLIDESIDE